MENSSDAFTSFVNGKGILILAFAALLALSGFASASVNPKVQLINATLSEVPAQPGHVVELKLFFKSVESDNCAERVSVQISVSYPLSVRGPDTQYIDLLCYRDPDSKGTIVFELPVDNLATSGTYPVLVTTTYEKRFTKFSESNTVNVQVGGSPAFSASVISSNPVDIYPGDLAQITVSFQNTGASMVRSAKASAQSNDIEVKWAGQVQNIGQIPARGSASAVFFIEAPKSLKPGNYTLAVALNYTGEDMQNGSASFSFAVPVKPKAEFAASAEGASFTAGQKKEVQIKLTNTGWEEARKVKVKIKPLFPFSTDGTVRYVESIPAKESVNLTYAITVDKDATAGEQLTGMLIEFENPQGRKFSESVDFSLLVRTPDIFEQAISNWYLIAAAALIAAMALKKKKKEG